MYWSAWSDEGNLEDGQIVRTSMDGRMSTSTVLFDNSQVVWPNGLTLDYQTQTLYWVDAQADTVSKSRADGTNRQVILELKETDIVDKTKWHAFGVDYFNDILYFGNWFNDSVFSFNVNSPTSTLKRVAQLNTDPGSMHVIDLQRQPTGESELCFRHTHHMTYYVLQWNL